MTGAIAVISGLAFGYVAGRYGPRMIGLYQQSRRDGYDRRASLEMAWRHGRGPC